MRGYRDFNFPAFDRAAGVLRDEGHVVFSPAERDRQHYGDDINNSKTGNLADIPQFNLREALLADLTWIVNEAEAIFLLSRWGGSLGARAELALAVALDLEVWEQEWDMNGMQWIHYTAEQAAEWFDNL